MDNVLNRLARLEQVVGTADPAPSSHLANRYLDLLEGALTGLLLDDPGYTPGVAPSVRSKIDPSLRAKGLDWPLYAQTMIGVARLKNIRHCISTVIDDKVPGDLIETGVWRGGSCIYMRANLEALGDKTRKVWVADSFEGLPPPDIANFPVDTGDQLHQIRELAVSLEEVKENFRKYGFLDDQVQFLKGFFKDTLHIAPIEKLAIARLDGDMYESTMQALTALYPKVSVGGFVIIDDWVLHTCRPAVENYRQQHGVTDVIHDIDGSAVYWRKT